MSLGVQNELGLETKIAPNFRVSNGIRALKGLTPLVAVGIFWQWFGSQSSPFFPPPNRWWDAMSAKAANGELWVALSETVGVFLVSLFLTVLLGTIIGILLGASRSLDSAMNPLFQFLRAIPAAAIVPAMVLLLGPTPGMTVAVIVFASIWPVMLSTRSGILNLNSLILEVSDVLELSRASRIRKVLLPSLYSSILLGTSVAAPIALLLTLLVQLLLGTSGIGGLLGSAQTQFDSAAVYGYVVICGILAIIVNAALRKVESSTHRYRATAK